MDLFSILISLFTVYWEILYSRGSEMTKLHSESNNENLRSAWKN